MSEQGNNHVLYDQIKNLTFDTLRKILDNSYDEIFVIDKDQNILYVNPVCQANYGLKQNEIIGKKAYELIQQGYCFPAVAPEVLKKKKQVTIEQETSVGKKLIVTATPVFNSEDEIELVVENSRDVTELEIIKQDLEDAQELVKRYESHHVIAKETLEILMDYTWPGNVRELQHLMERLVVTVKAATITPEHLPSALLQTVEKQTIDIFNIPIPLDDAVARVTRDLIVKAYDEFGSSYKVAKKLKISQSKANRLIRRFVAESKPSLK